MRSRPLRPGTKRELTGYRPYSMGVQSRNERRNVGTKRDWQSFYITFAFLPLRRNIGQNQNEMYEKSTYFTKLTKITSPYKISPNL